MKRFTVLLILALGALTSFSQSSDANTTTACDIMHSGKFMDAQDEDPSAYMIIDGNEVSEFSDFGKNVSKSHIKWNNDCSYTLTLLETTISELKEVIGKKMKVEILNVQGNTIKYKMILNGAEYERELVKVNDDNAAIQSGQVEVFSEILIF